MKNVFANWDWEDTASLLFTVFVVVFLALGIRAMVADHSVRYYYLSDECGILVIKADIDWCQDQDIKLDRAVTYEGAIQMVDDLNRGLGYVAPVDTLSIE